jgi:hypothetical protein
MREKQLSNNWALLILGDISAVFFICPPSSYFLQTTYRSLKLKTSLVVLNLEIDYRENKHNPRLV